MLPGLSQLHLQRAMPSRYACANKGTPAKPLSLRKKGTPAKPLSLHKTVRTPAKHAKAGGEQQSVRTYVAVLAHATLVWPK